MGSVINKYKDQIIDLVENNDVVVIQAETGTGKTTKIPTWFAKLGYSVTVTQPRRLAARTNAAYVSRKFNQCVGGIVGYRTGYEKCDSVATRLLYCTDGLELVREITGHGKTDILFIDEVHEWNTHIEGLVAWAKKMIAQKWNVKVVLMSATVDAEKLAEFFGGNTPIVKIKGHSFPVERRLEKPYRLVDTAISYINQRKNILIFRPGKKEILETINSLKGKGAVVLPLHSEISVEEQNRCFQPFSQPKVVVATKIAATSITIPEIDVVIDDGLDKSIRLFNGVEGLYEVEISKADCLQRAGRAGRTRPGKYILCSDVPMEGREEFPIPEINCVRLDQLCLKFLNAEIDPTTIDFFHQPDINALLDAKKSLKLLGAIDENDKVTDIGKLMSKVPVDVHLARMIVEGHKRGVVMDMITMAAILQFGGIRDSRILSWKEYTQEESSSDAIAELNLFKAIYGKMASLGDSPSARSKFSVEILTIGIKEKKFWGILHLRNKIINSLNGDFGTSSSGDRNSILLSYVSGMVDRLYKQSFPGHYASEENGLRKLVRGSVISGRSRLIVGTPVDIKARGSDSVFKIITMATEVDEKIVSEAAPHLIKKEADNASYNWFDELCTKNVTTTFNGITISEDVSIVENTSEALADYLVDITINPVFHKFQENIKNIIIKNAEVAISAAMTKEDLKAWYLEKLNGAKKVSEIKNIENLLLPIQIKIDSEEDAMFKNISALELLKKAGGKIRFFS